MHSLKFLCGSLLVASAIAQSPLATGLVGNNQGNIGGGIYFNLTVGANPITITDIAWKPMSIAAGIQSDSIDVYLGPTTYVGNVTNAALWTLVATSTAAQLTSDVLTTPQALTPGIGLAANTSYGVALRATGGTSGFSHRYTNGNGANQTHTTTELSFFGGAAQNNFLSGGIFQPRVWNGELYYQLGGAPISVASQERYGEGCYGLFTSYYEDFPNPTSMDVDGQSHLLTANLGTSVYDVSGNGAPYTAPGINAVAAAPGAGGTTFSVATLLGGSLPFPVFFPRGGGLGIADDLEVCHSGYITPVDVAGAGATAAAPGSEAPDNTPTVAEFLGNFERWCPHWKTMDTTAGGTISVELIGGTSLVIDWSGVSGNTFQIAIDVTGNVEYRYQTMSTGGGGSQPVIIGWTQGGGALANRKDISVDVPAGFSTDAADNAALSLNLDARPVLGTNPNFVIENYGAASLGANVLSFTQFNPGVPLAALGMGGCFQYVNLDVSNVFFVAGPTTSVPFIPGGIPNIGSLNGVLLYAQSGTFTAGFNFLGVVASNGLRVQLGSL